MSKAVEAKGEAKGEASAKSAKDVLAKPEQEHVQAHGKAESKEGQLVQRMIDYFQSYYLDFDNEELMELFDWETRYWDRFDPDAVGEYTIEHTDLHKQYCTLFEEKLEGFVRQQGISTSEFYRLLRTELEKGGGSKGEVGRGYEYKGVGTSKEDGAKQVEKLLSLIEKSSDFAVWAESMREAALTQRQMEDVD